MTDHDHAQPPRDQHDGITEDGLTASEASKAEQGEPGGQTGLKHYSGYEEDPDDEEDRLIAEERERVVCVHGSKGWQQGEPYETRHRKCHGREQPPQHAQGHHG